MVKIFEKVKADKRIIIGYSTSLFLLLVTYLITLYANNQLKKRAAMVEHSFNVIINVDRLLAKITDGETGVRGFGITGDTAFLKPFIRSRIKADSLYYNLMQLTKDNATQQKNLRQLKPYIIKRYQLFSMSIGMFKVNNGNITAYTKAFQQQGKSAMDTIRLITAKMQDEENRLISERDVKLKSTFASINAITLISLFLTLLLVLIGFLTYTKENKGRKTALQSIKQYQQELNNRITELNAANIQLKQMRSMEKFAATGRIARTIAHEVRNPLTNINLAAGQLKTDLAAPDENTQQLFEIIDRNSQRINKLISDLLNSTKFSELNINNVSVNSLLDEVLDMAKDRIELNHITIQKNYEATCNIQVDAEKVKIAFLNIIINAIEAMEAEKGILKINTKTESGKCFVQIEDNGSGMDETALNNLFEPYFTNKPNGNGLGLANTQNIIFNHKGQIAVQSSLQKGTIFNITLDAV